ncbi:MAG: hypothetical protein RIQ89_535 [Bacteroidota bacterium]|jgi:hypothetical protein
MDITGKIKQVFETQVVSDRFKKRDFVVTEVSNAQYPQHISFQLTQDKCDLLNSYRDGDDVKVHFNLRGREWKSPQGEIKYFNTLEAWKLEKIGSGASNTNYEQEAASMDTFNSGPSEASDDLPF